MTLSTISLDADTTTTAPAHICTFASWCLSHERTASGGMLHVSEISAGTSGLVSGVRAFSGADGEPIGDGTLFLYGIPAWAAKEFDVREWATRQVRQEMRDLAHLS
jgi:hypothetical protein